MTYGQKADKNQIFIKEFSYLLLNNLSLLILLIKVLLK